MQAENIGYPGNAGRSRLSFGAQAGNCLLHVRPRNRRKAVSEKEPEWESQSWCSINMLEQHIIDLLRFSTQHRAKAVSSGHSPC